MAVGKYTPNIAVQGDMGWMPVQVKIWKSVGRCWSRFSDMPDSRLNKRIFNWCVTNGQNRCKNWYFKFKTHMSLLNLEFLLDANKYLIFKKIYTGEDTR